jgi:hypothetical protein
VLGAGLSIVLLFGTALAGPQILDPAVATAVSVGHAVTVSPSPTPAFIPRAVEPGPRPTTTRGAGTRPIPRSSTRTGPTTPSRRVTPSGNHIAALVSSSPNSGYGPYTQSTHTRYGSTTLLGLDHRPMRRRTPPQSEEPL